MPPEGHVFLTVIVFEPEGSAAVPDCIVELKPLFSNSPAPRAARAVSDLQGRVEFVQPHGNYEISVICGGREPADPDVVNVDNPEATYSTYEVPAGRLVVSSSQ